MKSSQDYRDEAREQARLTYGSVHYFYVAAILSVKCASLGLDLIHAQRRIGELERDLHEARRQCCEMGVR